MLIAHHFRQFAKEVLQARPHPVARHKAPRSTVHKVIAGLTVLSIPGAMLIANRIHQFVIELIRARHHLFTQAALLPDHHPVHQVRPV